jgi:hypothetical protein
LHLDLFEQPAGHRELLKKAHLLRWRARALAAAYPEYASLGPPPAALHLDLFEQPAGHRRLLKKAHLLRWRARALAATYPEYVSLGPSRAALHLDLLARHWRI